MIDMALVAYIKANFAVTRVYAGQAPANVAVPAITVDLEGTFRDRHHKGDGTSDTGLIEADLELTVWDSTILTARQNADALAALLDNFRGSMTTNESPQNTYRVAFIQVTSENQTPDTQMERYTASVFITVSFTQS